VASFVTPAVKTEICASGLGSSSKGGADDDSRRTAGRTCRWQAAKLWCPLQR
jgi:hypothetical protein